MEETEYEKAYCNGSTDRVLGLYATLPVAVHNAQGFQGYCDGYMQRPRQKQKGIDLLKKIILSIDYC